jgi:uncharacterized cupredoxin-like copper-binding protein
MRLLGLVTAGLTLAGLAIACGGGGGGATVGVVLQEFSVLPAQTSAPAGSVTFEVENQGPDDVHEFVVVRTDLSADSLPTDDTGTVEEGAEGMEVVDEIEDIPVGDQPTLNVDLEAGSYVLICNIYDEADQEAHYSLGMRTAFTVQ